MTLQPMKTYRFTFNGRAVGALGVTQTHAREVTASDREAARLKLYETHEHILVRECVEVGAAQEAR